MVVRIRDGAIGDAAAIARIHNEGIEERTATLETELRTPEDVSQWLAERDSRYPVLVAVAREKVVGWGSLNRFNPRSVYDSVADFSLYVAREWRGRGVGAELMATLEARARGLGFHKLVLATLARNEAGIRFYARHGFRHVGVYEEQGRLDGQWVDVVLMEKVLEPPEEL